MKGILQKLLNKRGIESLDQLSDEEQGTYKQWNQILSKDELTIGDIREFCQSQCNIIEGKWKDYDLPNEKKAELIPYHTVYKTLLAVTDSPKVAREQLEEHLNNLLNA